MAESFDARLDRILAAQEDLIKEMRRWRTNLAGSTASGGASVSAWLKWNSLMLEYRADIVGAPAGHIHARYVMIVYHTAVINISNARIREGHQLIVLLEGNSVRFGSHHGHY